MDSRLVGVHTSGLCHATAWTYEREGRWLALVVEASLGIRKDGPMELLAPPARTSQPEPLPTEGRTSMLSGDEWLVLFGEGEVSPVLRTRLPKLRAAARLVGNDQPTRLVHLILAEFCLDVVNMRCTLRWKGTRELGEPLDDGTSLQAMVAVDGQPVSWPSARLAETPPKRGSATVSVSREALARAVTPFGAGAAVRGAASKPSPPTRSEPSTVLRPYQGQQVTMNVSRDALRRARRRNDAPLALRSEDLDFGAFEVLAASGFEALSASPRYDVDLRALAATFDPERILGKRATMRIGTGTNRRWVHGILTEVERMREAPDGRLRVRLESPLVAADHHARSRTFVRRSAEEVVRHVVEGLGWCPENGKATGTSPSLVYRFDRPEDEPCDPQPRFHAQYRETDLAFLGRLLVSEGLSYRVTSTQEQVSLVIARSRVPPIQDAAEQATRATVRLVAGRPPEVTVASDNPTHEPGAVLLADLGRGEASRCLVTGVSMRLEVGDDGTLSCRARLTLASRSPRELQVDEPKIIGGQIATTASLEGGRVRVRLPWEGDEPALSDWLDLPLGGAQEATLHVGDPLLVTFVDGAPHRPVVTARLARAQGSER